jgi:hypothetical protein
LLKKKIKIKDQKRRKRNNDVLMKVNSWESHIHTMEIFLLLIKRSLFFYFFKNRVFEH